MTTSRSELELAALREEAERRVRAGESRADISRALAVAPSTLSHWALRGGWRRKDIAAERAGELAQLAAERIAALRAREAAHGRLEWKSAQAPDDRPVSPEKLALDLAQALLQQGRLEEVDRAARTCVRLIEAAERLEERERKLAQIKNGWPQDETEEAGAARDALEQQLKQILADEDPEGEALVAQGRCPECGGPATDYLRHGPPLDGLDALDASDGSAASDASDGLDALEGLDGLDDDSQPGDSSNESSNASNPEPSPAESGPPAVCDDVPYEVRRARRAAFGLATGPAAALGSVSGGGTG